jgi:hypothetical protein
MRCYEDSGLRHLGWGATRKVLELIVECEIDPLAIRGLGLHKVNTWLDRARPWAQGEPDHNTLNPASAGNERIDIGTATLP